MARSSCARLGARDVEALLYNLRPYEANKISITPEDLPLDSTVDSTTAIMAPPPADDPLPDMGTVRCVAR